MFVISGLMQQTAMAMVRVFAQADIGDDDQVGRGGLDGAHGLLDDAVRRKILQADGIFGRGDAEEHHGRNAQRNNFARFGGQLIDGKLVDAGHGTRWRRARPCRGSRRADR